MKVVIAEKPSVARELANFLGATSKQDGYLEGNGFQVTWAIGHLVRLEDLNSYPGFESKDWKDTQSSLPYIPEPFRLVIARDDVKKQYFTVKRLFDNATEIIVATDAGQEGELIFRYIYSLSGSKKPFRRLWVSSLTSEALEKGFLNLKSGSDYDDLYFAAKARSEADWILGINLTRLYTVKFANESIRIVSIGRVQTPTLNLICKRFTENKNFQKSPFFVPLVTLNYDSKDFIVKYESQFPAPQAANEVLSKVGATLRCTDKRIERVTTNPPKLFNLTHLQQHLNKCFGFSAQKTLDLLQKLYEAKLVTYPRTDSNYLSVDMRGDVERSIQKFMAMVEPGAIDISAINPAPFDDEKVTDHHAIIPTGIVANLEGDEGRIFKSVVERFLQAFAKPCYDEKTTLIFGPFKAIGKVPIDLGWKKISLVLSDGKSPDDDDQVEDEFIRLPNVPHHSDCSVVSKECHKGLTAPPAIFTEATLLKAMEHASDQMDLPDTDRRFGIGTPATRAGIIEVLIHRSYIERQGKKLVPTRAGQTLYLLTKDTKIGSIELTAIFEEKLQAISTGQYSQRNFLNEITTLTAQSAIVLHTIDEREHTMSVVRESNAITCPKCKKGTILEKDKFFGCSDWKSGCSFKIWNEFAGRKLSFSQITAMIKKGRTSPLKFTSSKTGKEFEAPIRFNLETEKLEFIFEKS
ncbi:DNA topoisomerase-3 [Dyadobacter sp. SG02]|uniref:type IA DNA topoisomerase n=1 Tax=Dyadobacter sp. SG02 TaxID=1855291 RepID=UPI0008D0FA8C|nr:type IA DNA topoisomerase [Dyadobacter sp. SG02]SEJ74768.1 DNA topoisomerase-3 [Dyadobacter sp. SG02]